MLLLLYLRSSFALLLSTENRISTRNITCRHGLSTFHFNCEACLITSRNYDIETTLSLVGAGLAGISCACLQVNDIEVYHTNLIRECLYFPRNTLDGFDDFCIAAPYNLVRGSYRACICTTNGCNYNYTRCMRQINLYRDRKVPLFNHTLVDLTERVQCYQSDQYYRPLIHSKLLPFCSENDEECHHYLNEHGVLCLISVDRNNQISRQTLIPSTYSAYLIEYKTQLCKSFSWKSKSIYFSECDLEGAVCMCAVNECDKDLQTCRTSEGVCQKYYSVFFIFYAYIVSSYLRIGIKVLI